MKILFLTSAHNSLSQRLEIQLTERGHEIRVREWRQPKKAFVAAYEERCKAAIRMIAGCLASRLRQPTKLLTEMIGRIMLSSFGCKSAIFAINLRIAGALP